jgi:hypothetical protein
MDVHVVPHGRDHYCSQCGEVKNYDAPRVSENFRYARFGWRCWQCGNEGEVSQATMALTLPPRSQRHLTTDRTLGQSRLRALLDVRRFHDHRSKPAPRSLERLDINVLLGGISFPIYTLGTLDGKLYPIRDGYESLSQSSSPDQVGSPDVTGFSLEYLGLADDGSIMGCVIRQVDTNTYDAYVSGHTGILLGLKMLTHFGPGHFHKLADQFDTFKTLSPPTLNPSKLSRCPFQLVTGEEGQWDVVRLAVPELLGLAHTWIGRTAITVTAFGAVVEDFETWLAQPVRLVPDSTEARELGQRLRAYDQFRRQHHGR